MITNNITSKIQYRGPYYVRCSLCDTEISEASWEKLSEIRDWRYDTEEDILYCPECWEEEGKEIEAGE